MLLVEIPTSWRRILGFGKVTHLIINDKKTACGHKVEGELREITMSNLIDDLR